MTGPLTPFRAVTTEAFLRIDRFALLRRTAAGRQAGAVGRSVDVVGRDFLRRGHAAEIGALVSQDHDSAGCQSAQTAARKVRCLCVDMLHLAARQHAPGRDAIAVIIGPAAAQRHHLGARRLHVAGVVGDAALQQRRSAVPAPRHVEAGEAPAAAPAAAAPPPPSSCRRRRRLRPWRPMP